MPDAPPKAPSFKTLGVRAPHAALTSANAALPLYGFQLPSRRTAQLIKHKLCKTLIKKRLLMSASASWLIEAVSGCYLRSGHGALIAAIAVAFTVEQALHRLVVLGESASVVTKTVA